MTEREGTIKFQLEFSPADPPPENIVAEISAWRTILKLTRLIGQDPQRYGGYGYGNISQRYPARATPRYPTPFIISGTQTGHLAELGTTHYATVLTWDPRQNLIVAEGPLQPSSESLTHAAIYALDDQIQTVIHTHSPEIWRHARDLQVPITLPKIPYGTPAMAEEMRRLWHEAEAPHLRILAMGGHEDGVISFGHSAEEAGVVLLRFLARGLQMPEREI